MVSSLDFNIDDKLEIRQCLNGNKNQSSEVLPVSTSAVNRPQKISNVKMALRGNTDVLMHSVKPPFEFGRTRNLRKFVCDRKSQSKFMYNFSPGTKTLKAMNIEGATTQEKQIAAIYLLVRQEMKLKKIYEKQNKIFKGSAMQRFLQKKIYNSTSTGNDEDEAEIVDVLLKQHKSIEKQLAHKTSYVQAVVGFMFFLAFIAAFAAGIASIETAKKASRDGHPQSTGTVLFLFFTKLLKAPKIYFETWENRHSADKLFFNGLQLLGVTVAGIIWAVALHYTLK